MAITIDINATHKLALITDDDLGNPRYEPLTESHQISDAAPNLAYLPQYHTVANTVSQGIIALPRGFPQDGWQRLTEAEGYRRGAPK